jgi:hypothetical protein
LDDAYIKAMFGVYAIHAPVQLIMQDMGSENGQHRTLAAALISTPVRLLTEGYPHELVVGDMIIRPFGKWASARKFVGRGLTGLVTSDAVFPQGHEVQTLENGWEAIRKRAGL